MSGQVEGVARIDRGYPHQAAPALGRRERGGRRKGEGQGGRGGRKRGGGGGEDLLNDLNNKFIVPIK